MMKLQKIYMMLAALTLAFAGCDKFIYDQPQPDGEGADHKVHLFVNVRAAQPTSGLRAQGLDPSINMDGVDYEDYVHNLAMVIFKSGAAPAGGERVGVYTTGSLGSSMDSTRAFTAEINPGEYDFYFVANMDGLTKTWIEANIADRSAMDVYLNTSNRLLTESLYRGATVTPTVVGFPMARVYLNQEITTGGNIYQPKPFRPKQYTNEENVVVANGAGNGNIERNYVELIRVVAKLEVNLDGTTDLGVDKIYFRNANRHFRLVEFDAAPTEWFNDNTTNVKELKQIGTTPQYIYYMPEAIIPNTVTWSGSGANHQPINYFTIVTLDGTEYDIPIISNETSITADYLEKAKGTFTGYTPDYTIHRNHHYKYVVRNLEQIEVIYQINPWNKVTRSTYLGYGYNVHIDEDGKVTINNTVDACPPHEIKLVAINGATFGSGTPPTERIFTDDTPGASSLDDDDDDDYSLSNIPSSGEYLQVWFNGILVKTFSN